MRALILIGLIAATAAPAGGQGVATLSPQGLPTLPPDDGLWMQLELSRQHSIFQDNRLMSLEAQLRTDQALRQLEAERVRPFMPQPIVPAPVSSSSTRPATASPYASIPDDRLAASNARIRALAGGQ